MHTDDRVDVQSSLFRSTHHARTVQQHADKHISHYEFNFIQHCYIQLGYWYEGESVNRSQMEIKQL
jgi:hypothetical protein